MARSRNIKPKFFTNDLLAELPYEGRLLFIGLWTVADREGRLLDRPKKIKMELFPADSLDIEPLLAGLAERGFIRRYMVGDHSCIQIVNWHKHQSPHFKEQKSAIPAPDERREDRDAHDKPDANPRLTVVPSSKSLRHASDMPEAFLGQDSDMPDASTDLGECQHPLIPDSGYLIADSGLLIPDTGSLIPDPIEKQPPATADAAAPKRRRASPAKKDKDAPNPLNLASWQAYKHAYAERYGIAPIQNAKSNSLFKQLVQALGESAVGVAAFFVKHNDRNYVSKMHQPNLLLADHAKLHTEWATNEMMTATKAAQVDKTATNLDAFGPLLAEAEAREAMGG